MLTFYFYFSYQKFIEEDASVVDITNKEASTIYEIYRILSKENYELGRSVKEFVTSFRDNNMDIDKTYTRIPIQMEETLSFIEDCSQNFHCYYNLGDKNVPGNKLHYSKPAVEKFIFNKIYPVIFELYNRKYKVENDLFLKKQSIIKEKLNYKSIMEFLEVRSILF